jgi:exosortase A
MPPELAIAEPMAPANIWRTASLRLVAAAAALFVATFAEWREMAHQWWDIDTYAHILLIPPILAWLAWLRREELAKTTPEAWRGGLLVLLTGLCLCLLGRLLGVNLIAQAGAVVALQGAVVTILGLRAAILLAFPLLYALFLVPFGDEIVAPLQTVTARIAVGLTHLSGGPATLRGFYIDTPAGRFIVAEECSGVKFLIAMVALGTLVAWTAFRSWKRRSVFLAGAVVISIVANGIRAWGTVFAAQYVGAARAGGIDHLVYGWIFFAVIVGAVLATAWRFFEREPHEAGLTAEQAEAIAARYEGRPLSADAALWIIVAAAIGFAVVARLV